MRSFLSGFLVLTILASPALLTTTPAQADPAEEICAGYTKTPGGERARKNCETTVRRKLPRWLRLIPLHGNLDYYELCPPRGPHEGNATREEMDCYDYAGKTVMWVRHIH